MRRIFLVLALTSLCALTTTSADSDIPKVVQPEELHWVSPPWDARVQATWVLGSESGQGPYLLRVRIAPGGKIPAHTHPDARQTTVLSGSLRVSFGADADPAKALVLPAGSVYLAPAHQTHTVWADETEVTYQETGNGPTKTEFLNR